MKNESKLGEAATIRDVARHAGVALSSVSRVLSGHPDVSDAMRARVNAAVADLGYQPDLLARSLRSGSSKTVGFVLRDISNPLFASIASRCERVLRAAGFSMVITSSDGDAEAEAMNLDVLRRRRVDALIASLVSESAPATKQSLAEFAVPVVLLDRQVEGLDAGAVLCDHYYGVRQATEALLALGHRRIGLITGSLDVRSSRERRRAYLDAFAAAGVEPDPELLAFGDFDQDFAKAQTSRFLSASPRTTALLTGGLGTTVGALRAIRQLRLTVGEDIALVALDDWPSSDVLVPTLSSVVRDANEMGTAAAQLLLDMIGGAPPRIETIDTVFNPRASIGRVGPATG